MAPAPWLRGRRVLALVKGYFRWVIVAAPRGGYARAVSAGVVLREVSFWRGTLAIVEAQSLHVPAGEGVVISGANGVGKSTLLHLCAGLLKPQRGSVTLNGQQAHQPLPSRLLRSGVRRAVVFQYGGLVAQLSALENVMLPLRYHADVLGLDEATIEARARAQLERLGLLRTDVHALPGRLSVGLQKRVAFARALAIEPQFMFCDDPDAGLDDDNRERILQRLLAYRHDPCVTLVLCSNRRSLIRRLKLPVVVLAEGRLTRPEQASPPPDSSV